MWPKISPYRTYFMNSHTKGIKLQYFLLKILNCNTDLGLPVWNSLNNVCVVTEYVYNCYEALGYDLIKQIGFSSLIARS